jgi:hypothetical protein
VDTPCYSKHAAEGVKRGSIAPVKKSFLAGMVGSGIAAALLLGCGGNVVVDQGGGVGASGGGGTGGGSTVVDPEEVCQSACDAEDQFNCPKELGAGDCVATCVTSFQAIPQCNAELGALLACGTADLLATGNCMGTAACQATGDAFIACVEKVSGP